MKTKLQKQAQNKKTTFLTLSHRRQVTHVKVCLLFASIFPLQFINFSNEFLNYENEENKLKIINSIVNTLTNLKEINSVSFLINGEKNEKISEIYLKNK